MYREKRDRRTLIMVSCPHHLPRVSIHILMISFQLCNNNGMEVDKVSTLFAKLIKVGARFSCLQCSRASWKLESLS